MRDSSLVLREAFLFVSSSECGCLFVTPFFDLFLNGPVIWQAQHQVYVVAGRWYGPAALVGFTSMLAPDKARPTPVKRKKKEQ